MQKGIKPKDFNSYGSRRGNDEIMARGTFANIRLVNKLAGKTGVEMESLTAVTVAALTVYDMCKAVDRGMRLSDIRLVQKGGGKSGNYRCADDE